MTQRPIVGFILSPLVAPFVVGILLLLDGHQNVHGAFWITGAAFSYFIMLIVGLPVHFALTTMKLQKWFLYCFVGGIVGLLFSWHGGVELASKGSVIFACAGALSGLVWWLLAVRGVGK
jgi:hypothetical protein